MEASEQAKMIKMAVTERVSGAGRCLPLPLSAGVCVQPWQSAQVTGRSQIPEFWFHRLVIKQAKRWVVQSIELGGRRCLFRPVPGEAFSADAVGTPLVISEPLDAGDDFIILVRYVGPHEEGEPFECCAFGSEQRDQRGPDRESGTIETASVVASSRVPIPSSSSMKLEVAPLRERGLDAGFWPERLVIKDAADWVVNDVLVKDESLLVTSGDLPGVMFSGGPNCPLIRMGHLSPDDKFSILATYIGDQEAGAVLEYSLSGPRHARDQSRTALGALMPMNSYVAIQPDKSAQITVRTAKVEPGIKASGGIRRIPAGHGFRPGRIVVDRPDDWVINDFKIGVASQFAQTGDVPGGAFAADAVDCEISFEPARPKIDVAMVVTNVGEREGGSAFACGIAGDIVPLAPR